MRPTKPHLSGCLSSALLHELLHQHLDHPSNFQQLLFTAFQQILSNLHTLCNLPNSRSFSAHLALMLLTHTQIMTKNPPGFLASSSATVANHTLPAGDIAIDTTTPIQTPSHGTNTNCMNTTGEGNVNCMNTIGEGNDNCMNTTGNGNKNCTNCRNCFNCTNCHDCADCNDCMNCKDCRGCEECKNCLDCAQCVSCMNCSNLKGVTGGKNQSGQVKVEAARSV